MKFTRNETNLKKKLSLNNRLNKRVNQIYKFYFKMIFCPIYRRVLNYLNIKM
jgi:hypothetical protein